MVKQQILLCLLVSLAMSLVLPIISVEVFVAANDIEERPNQAAYAEAIEKGASPEVAMAGSLRKIAGLERITHHFKDWYSFQTYLAGVAHYFIVLMVATLIVSGGRLYKIRTT